MTRLKSREVSLWGELGPFFCLDSLLFDGFWLPHCIIVGGNISSRAGRIYLAGKDFLRILVTLVFAPQKFSWEIGRSLFEKPVSWLWDCGWRHRWPKPGCLRSVFVVLDRKKINFWRFSSCAFTGFLLLKHFFCQREAYFSSRSGRVVCSWPRRILGRENMVWAAHGKEFEAVLTNTLSGDLTKCTLKGLFSPFLSRKWTKTSYQKRTQNGRLEGRLNQVPTPRTIANYISFFVK